MLREPLVEERVVRGQQIDDVAILPHDAFKEQFRLAPETLPQLVVPVGIEHSIRRRRRQIPQVQQLIGEVFHQSLAIGIGEHAPHLLLEHTGLLSFPWLARLISSSSGMLLHRKNDKREANSRSVMR